MYIFKENKKVMHTKIVYTLVSDNTDTYLEQALLSVYSLRMYNPDVVVLLVIDQETSRTISGSRAEIKKYITDLVEVEVPLEYSKVQKSRYLKTNLRKFVKGDFLFIDCDTIICDSLAEIDEVDADIAMVADLNGDLLLKDPNTLQKYRDAGFGEAIDLPYFNSGVIYAKDTSSVHEFYADWYTNWCKSDSNGVKYDQPALCMTNADNGLMIKELAGVWNCQFKMEGSRYLREAKIMHYYSNNGQKEHFFTLPMDMLYQQVREEGITPLIDKLIRHAKTDLYAVMTVNNKQYMNFFNSHSLYLYTNRPALYEIMEKIGGMLEKIMYR